MSRIDSALGLYGYVIAAGLAMFVLLFWLMGAINLTYPQGSIANLQLEGGWATAFWAYPWVAAGGVVLGGLAFLAKRYDAAVGLAGLPVASVAGYYLALVLFLR